MATHSVLLPGKSHGWRSIVGYSPWGCKELDTTEWLHFTSSSVSFSHQEASINLLSLSIRGQTENHNHRKLIKLITWTTALSNSVKLWAMPCRATKTEGSWWRVLTKRGPLEKGMTNHLSILAWRTSWTVWKGKRTWLWNVNSVPNTLLEKNGEITPERMKRRSQSKNSASLWMWLVMEVKSNAVKSNTA